MTSFEARSRAAFAERFPDIMARLEQSNLNAGSVVIEDGHAIDILVEDRPVYGGDARAFAADQVAAFMKTPLRMFMHRPNAAGLVSPVCIRLLSALGDWTNENLPEGLDTKPVNSPTFLVSFGLGLGYHVEALAAQTEARWLVIAEPLLEFFAHSFLVVDWAALIALFDKRGGGIRIVTDLDPGHMVTGIVRYIKQGGIPYADGAWVFTHYPSWSFTEARKRLYEAVEFAFVNRGFFEDELRMMDTAMQNFSSHSFWLLEGGRRRQRPELAVIVGAGPSLDEGIEVLREIRDRIVLFSAGTALRALLRNGLVPDYHCELENVPAVFGVLSETDKTHSLKDITLLASATIDARVPPMFRDTIFYFRDSVVSTKTVGRKFKQIDGTAPTCVNMALSTLATAGFTDFLLFGTDCGVRDGGDHHAAGTVYLDVDEFRKHVDEVQYPLEIEGNFGGIVKSNWIYDACRLMLAESIKYYGLNVINCSDGAIIPGAVPRVPEALRVTRPPVDPAAVKAALERSMTRYAPGEILTDADPKALAACAEAMYDDLDSLLDELAAGEPDFDKAYRRLMAFVGAAGDKYMSVEALIAGTMSALPRVAMFFAFRLEKPEHHRAIFEVFVAEFREIALTLRSETAALFARIERPDADRVHADRVHADLAIAS
jgi:hypothetical protein